MKQLPGKIVCIICLLAAVSFAETNNFYFISGYGASVSELRRDIIPKIDEGIVGLKAPTYLHQAIGGSIFDFHIGAISYERILTKFVVGWDIFSTQGDDECTTTGPQVTVYPLTLTFEAGYLQPLNDHFRLGLSVGHLRDLNNKYSYKIWGDNKTHTYQINGGNYVQPNLSIAANMQRVFLLIGYDYFIKSPNYLYKAFASINTCF